MFDWWAVCFSLCHCLISLHLMLMLLRFLNKSYQPDCWCSRIIRAWTFDPLSFQNQFEFTELFTAAILPCIGRKITAGTNNINDALVQQWLQLAICVAPVFDTVMCVPSVIALGPHYGGCCFKVRAITCFFFKLFTNQSTRRNLTNNFSNWFLFFSPKQKLSVK